ncbi:hypothetical protein [Erwinia typographi]|uniref:hypothetical protein n=1 Tax=Erwinia typographi TaxID=371042 RepID=UPI000689F28F|nr:hypothetical protein [Erwinia typographi]
MIYSDLYNPVLPQAYEGNIIYLSDIEIGGGVFVGIPEYSNAMVSDFIKIYWDGKVVDEYYLTELSDVFPIAFCISSEIDVGSHELYYMVTDIANNVSTSDHLTVIISDGDNPGEYPPPEFTDAVDGVIFWKKIKNNNGTYVHITPYDDISLGDTLHVYFSKGGHVYYKVITVDAGGVSNGINFLLGYDFISLSGDGELSSYYQVFDASMSFKGSSDKAVVVIKDDDNNDDEIDITVTKGSSNTDYSAIHVYPFNYGLVKGKAGKDITITTSNEVLFSPEGISTITGRIDDNGLLYFKLYSSYQGEFDVVAYETNSVNVEVRGWTNFSPYYRGNGNIHAINYSTGAPCDGITPCSIYLKATPGNNISLVRVRILNGSAMIVGYGGQIADILLNDDFSAEVNIVNSSSEVVNIELSLPESSGSVNYIKQVFVSY